MDPIGGVVGVMPHLLDGLWITLQICLCGTLLAAVLSGGLLAMRLSRNPVVRGIALTYVTLIRGLPILILIFLLYFGLPAALGVGRFSAFWVGVLALGLNGAAFFSEVLRAALGRIPAGQGEAARALGLRPLQRWRLVILPQMIPIATPALVGEVGFLIKASPVLSLITVVDLTRRAQQIAMRTFDPLTPLLGAAILYFILIGSISLTARMLERRMQQRMH